MNSALRLALRKSIDRGTALDADMALAVLSCSTEETPEVLAASNAVRIRNFGNTVKLCSIVNGKSGKCGENCKFCAQSGHYEGTAEVYPLLGQERFLEARDEAAELPVHNFGIVTSGGALSEKDLETVIETLKQQPNGKVRWCGSFGALILEQFSRLKEAGLTRYHHNLETARSFYSEICTTHDYQERVDTVRVAKEAGLEVCSGGLFGMGESFEQRVELAMEFADLGINEIPLNFLVPIPGTPLGDRPLVSPMEMLRTVAMVRLTNPAAGVRLAAGRVQLGGLQSMLFQAGCTSMMIGKLLTVAGGDPDEDLQMLKDLEMRILQGE